MAVFWDYQLKFDGVKKIEGQKESFDNLAKNLRNMSWSEKPRVIDINLKAYVEDGDVTYLVGTNDESSEIASQYRSGREKCGNIKKTVNLNYPEIEKKANTVPLDFEMCDLTDGNKKRILNDMVFNTSTRVLDTSLKCQGLSRNSQLSEIVYGMGNYSAACNLGSHIKKVDLSDGDGNADKIQFTVPAVLDRTTFDMSFANGIVDQDQNRPKNSMYRLVNKSFVKFEGEPAPWLKARDCWKVEFFVPYKDVGTAENKMARLRFNKTYDASGNAIWTGLDQTNLPSIQQFRIEESQALYFNLQCRWKSYDYLGVTSIQN